MPFGIRRVPAVSEASCLVELKDFDSTHIHVLSARLHGHIPNARHSSVVRMDHHVRNLHAHLFHAELDPCDLVVMGKLRDLLWIVTRNWVGAEIANQLEVPQVIHLFPVAFHHDLSAGLR